MIPLFEYVYHPLICFISQYNLALLRQLADPTYSRLALARALTWGHLVTFNLNEDLLSQEVDEVALRLVRAASVARSGYGHKFLVLGAMLRPLQLQSGSVTVRLAGRPVGRVSAIQHSVWRAPDGAIGVILTNIGSERSGVEIPVRLSELGLTAGAPHVVAAVRETGFEVLEEALLSHGSYRLVLSPAEVVLVTVEPLKRPRKPVAVLVTNGLSFHPHIAGGAWISVFGAGFARRTREWTIDDFAGTSLPLSLDNVRVSVNGRPAAIAYISPTQINALTPTEMDRGWARMQVETSEGSSEPVVVYQDRYSPALASYPGSNVAVAVAADGSLLGDRGTLSYVVRGARPGEVVQLFGTGFGPVGPPWNGYELLVEPRILASPTLDVRVGGLRAAVRWAGMVLPGLYQLNVEVPEKLPPGQWLLEAEAASLRSQFNLKLPVTR